MIMDGGFRVYTFLYYIYSSLGGGNQKVALLKPRFQQEKTENIELCGQDKGLVLGLSLLVKYHLI